MIKAAGAFLVALSIVMAAAAQQPDTRRNPLAGDGNAVAAGQRVFDRTCQSCHGPAGRGDSGPPLTSGSFTRGSDDDDLFRTIRNGVPGSQMPSFKQLSDNEIWQVVSYLRSLAAPVDPRRPIVVARTQDGREIQGVRVNEDTFTLQVIDASGRVHTLNKQTLVRSPGGTNARAAGRVPCAGRRSARVSPPSGL